MKTKCPVVGVDVYREKRERERRFAIVSSFGSWERRVTQSERTSSRCISGTENRRCMPFGKTRGHEEERKREAVDSLSEKGATEKIPVNAGKILISADAWKVARLRNFKG